MELEKKFIRDEILCKDCVPVNQCDGCRSNLPKDENGFHRDSKGHAVMICQAYRYDTL